VVGQIFSWLTVRVLERGWRKRGKIQISGRQPFIHYYLTAVHSAYCILRFLTYYFFINFLADFCNCHFFWPNFSDFLSRTVELSLLATPLTIKNFTGFYFTLTFFVLRSLQFLSILVQCHVHRYG